MNKSINKSELVNRKFINNWNIEDFEIENYDYNKEMKLGKIPVAEQKGRNTYAKYNSCKSKK